MRYEEEIIEEVRLRNPIQDVIGEYVHLTRKGANYVGLCPFHNEKTPSFVVSSGKQIYHCFGCNKGGNVFNFLMEHENCSFPEALESLANRAGVELPKKEFTPEMKAMEDKRTVLRKIEKEAAIFYVHALLGEGGKKGLAYLKDRGLSDETIRSFGLGFATAHTGELYGKLKEKGYEDKDLKDAGLFTYSEKGVRDKFWNRVMFPIMDANNHVIAFGGRVMGDGEPKYLNSPETKIFDKSRNLYGLNVAKRYRQYFLLCEGYMDVISLHQAGFQNAIASLGTAFTEQHAGVISRYVKDVVICYDSDQAGQKAALRAIPILKKADLRVRVLNLSPYKDPDEFIKALGTEAFAERITKATNSLMFQIEALRKEYDFTNPEDKSRFFNEVAKWLSEIPDLVERTSYIEAVANTYGISYQILNTQVSVYGNRNPIAGERDIERKPRAVVKSLKKKEDGNLEAQKLVLTCLCDFPEIFKKVERLLTEQDFSEGIYRKVAILLYDQFQKGKVNPSALFDRLSEDEEERNEASRILNMELIEGMTEAEKKLALSEAVIRIKRARIQQEKRTAVDGKRIHELMEEEKKLATLKLDF